MAEAYGTRPSELVGIVDAWPAFCFDEAIFVKHRLWLNEQNENRGRRFAPQGYDPPPQKVRAQIPWSGDGPDPLQGPS